MRQSQGRRLAENWFAHTGIPGRKLGVQPSPLPPVLRWRGETPGPPVARECEISSRPIVALSSLRRSAVTRMLRHTIRSFFHRDDGPTAVEYAVMMALIMVVVMAATLRVGTTSNKTFKKVSNTLKTKRVR